MQEGMQEVGIRYNIIASFQYRENYAAHDWDGVGDCPQGWKFKGGGDEIIACALSREEADAFLADDAKVRALCAEFEYSHNYASNELVSVLAIWERVPTFDEEVDLSLDYGLRFDKATGLLVKEYVPKEEETETVHYCDSTAGCTGKWCRECGYHRTEQMVKNNTFWEQS